MASRLKAPPVFKPEDDDDYGNWKNDLEIWKMFTDTKPEKLGPAVYLSLEGRAREAVRGITAEELGKPEGYATIVNELDKIFLQDETSRAFMAFKDFYEYKREAGIGFSQFMVDFDRRYTKLAEFKLQLPDGVQAFFLLKAANLTSESEKLARTVAKLEYKNMRETIMKIFGDPGVLDNADEVPDVKDVLYGDSYNKYRGGRNGRGRGGRGRFAERNTSHTNWRSSSSGNEQTNSHSDIPRCYECDSTKHFANKCPHRTTRKRDEGQSSTTLSEEVHMNVHIALLTSNPYGTLLKETFGKMLLDSACSKTCAGRLWYEEICSSMSELDKKDIVEKPTRAIFRFGDGVESNSIKCTTIPIYIGDLRILLDIEVVDKKIPLLLSRAAMHQLKITINFGSGEMMFNQKVFKLQYTSGGHMAVPVTLTDIDRHELNFVFTLECIAGATRGEKMTKAMKLHRQFSHASKEKLKKLLKDGGCTDAEFLEWIVECCENCNICLQFKKPPLKPVVAFPFTGHFNDRVCMDLKEHEHHKTWILHLIDASTRYSGACIVKTKRKDVIVASIFKIWIAYFGCPDKFFSDNGGEFWNDVYTEMAEKMNVTIETTAAESPFSNGIVERHNGTLYEAFQKTLKDTGCDADMALAWAVSAKNALQNASGYSPNQLVFGRNPNMPSVLIDQPPALEPTTSSEIVRKNLDAMHAARKNYIASESSERIRRALRHKVRSYADQHYESGQQVFYRRKSMKGWRGPGKVIGTEGKCVFVRHGAAIYRCHPCHLMKVEAAPKAPSTPMEQLCDDEGEDTIDKEVAMPSSVTDEDSDRKVREYEGSEDELQSSDSEHDDTQQNTETEQNELQSSDSEHDDTQQNTEAEQNNLDDQSSEINVQSVESSTSSGEVKRPKPRSYVEYELEDGVKTRAKVLSQQPKRTKHNGNWMNVHITGEENPSGVDWNKVVSWQEVDAIETVLLLTESEGLEEDIMVAKQAEIAKLQSNSVYEVIPYDHQSLISSKWVVTKKERGDGKPEMKARLVARGFEENSQDLRTDSPTCSKQALRMVFLVAAAKKWELHSLDIASAFLQGGEITRNVYLRPPTEFAVKGTVWKLNRCIYGLNDAPRAWYDRVKDELRKLHGKMSKYDNALFSWHDATNQLEGIMALHVDDFVISGTKDWYARVVDMLCTTFHISAYHRGSFKYVGLNVTQVKDAIILDQHKYIAALEEVPLDATRRKMKDDILTEEEVTSLRSASGQIHWAATQSRPDAAYDACVVANYGTNPTVKNLLLANKAIRKIKSQPACIKFPDLGDPEHFEILIYSDAAHANLPSGASQGACISFVAGNNKVAPVHWQSRKLARVPKSSLAAETLMIAESGDNGVFTASVLQEIFGLHDLPPIRVFTDSKSFCDHLHSTHVLTDTRMRVDMARIREMLSLSEIKISWVPSERQLADALTKQGAASGRLRQVLNNARI